jgi:hypothetical protein
MAGAVFVKDAALVSEMPFKIAALHVEFRST